MDETLRQDLTQVFSRGQDFDNDGLSAGFLLGTRHQSVVIGKSPRHRGLLVGTVRAVSDRGVTVELCGPLKRGDGVVFDRGFPEEKEEGGLIFEIFDGRGESVGLGIDDQRDHGLYRLTFGKGAVELSRIKPGDRVWRSRDSSFDGRMKTYMMGAAHHRNKVKVCVRGSLNEPLEVCVFDDQGREGRGYTESVLQPATRRPIVYDDIIKAIGTLGNTSFSLSEIDTEKLAPGMFVPIAEIKAARRTAVTNLYASRVKTPGGTEVDKTVSYRELVSHAIENSTPSDALAQVSPLCRTPMQVTAACQIPWVTEIYVDFLEVHGLREAVALVKRSGKRCIVATPRIIKPDEQRLWIFYLRLKPDALLIRSIGFLQQMVDFGGPGVFVKSANSTIPELIGDFSLNPSNTVTSILLLESGLSRITPTHDLNANQICNLAKTLGHELSKRIEVIAHQHLPIFHTEHCVFCRFLSSGNSYKDCGHPCETNRIHLRGMDGSDNVVLADQGCRNTVFNAQAQSAAQYMDAMVQSGIRKFRVEFVDEPADVVEPLLEKYRNICEKKRNAARSLIDWLDQVPDSNGRLQGSTSGSLRPLKEISRSQLKQTAYQKS